MDNKKKFYVKPECQVHSLIAEQMLALSFGEANAAGGEMNQDKWLEDF